MAASTMTVTLAASPVLPARTVRSGASARVQSVLRPTFRPAAGRLQEGASRSRRSNVIVRAETSTEEKPSTSKPQIAEFADSIGLPTDEGLFGFKPFSEVWVGRLAMAGFLSSLVGEFLTGKGTLQQIGLVTPSPSLFWTIAVLGSSVTFAATFRTVIRASGKQMSPKEAARYKQFLGLKNEGQNVTQTQKEMKADWVKGGGDFTAPLNEFAVEKTRREPKPVDPFLNMGDRKDANQASKDGKSQPSPLDIDPIRESMQAANELKEGEKREPGPNMALDAKYDVVEQDQFQSEEMKYARGVELGNGRWAMLGFFAAILVEAGTGRGIIGQIIDYLKAANVLGPASGF